MAQLDTFFTAEGVLLAYLFGSLTHTNQAHDIDLALLLPPDKRQFPSIQPSAIPCTQSG
ncbi:MAG: nucleotidyltransferase domain-containing protein [Chloroflexi bacterium]|nr:nucleotidyltransferase domain-containing protein [Chloroflexota bacterium]